MESMKKLSLTEEIVMKAIYDLSEKTENSVGIMEEVSIPNLIEYLRCGYGRDYARTTVVTFLQRMAAKGAVFTQRRGRISYVMPIYDQEAYRKFLLQQMVEHWYKGDKDKMMEELEQSVKKGDERNVM